MATSNIEQFDRIVGQTFALLYEAFPLPLYIPLDKYTDGRPVLEDIGNGCEGTTKEADIIAASLVWLIETGYITGSLSPGHALGHAVLTAKGLETLKAIPDSLNAPLGERIKEAAAKGGSELLRALASQAISAGSTILLKSVS